MKVAITGHTSGIGLSLAKVFQENGHEIIGFSRKTGFDIAVASTRAMIISQLSDCDIFINNAWDQDGQYGMLTELLNVWQGKSVINISSNIGVLPESFFEIEALRNYRDSKKQIDDFISEYTGPITMLNVLPDLTKTNFSLNIDDTELEQCGKSGMLNTEYGMDPDYVANLIYNEFNQNPNNKSFNVSHLEYMQNYGK